MSEMLCDTHDYARPAGRGRGRRWLAILAIAAATLADPIPSAKALIPSCNEVQVTVWGVITPGSTFGLIKNLEALPGVETARFDLRKALATVRLRPGVTVTDDQLRSAVKSASYTSREIGRPAECPASVPGR